MNILDTEPDSGSIEGLVREYGEQIYRFCFRLTGNTHDAEDLAQEVFLAAHQRMKHFAGRSAVSTYLYRIAIFQHRAKTKRCESANVSLHSVAEPVGCDDSSGHDLRMTLEHALSELSSIHREAFILVKVEGLSCVEAARAQRVPVGTLKFRVHRAVKLLQASLGDSLLPDSSATLMPYKEATHAL